MRSAVCFVCVSAFFYLQLLTSKCCARQAQALSKRSNDPNEMWKATSCPFLAPYDKSVLVISKGEIKAYQEEMIIAIRTVNLDVGL